MIQSINVLARSADKVLSGQRAGESVIDAVDRIFQKRSIFFRLAVINTLTEMEIQLLTEVLHENH